VKCKATECLTDKKNPLLLNLKTSQKKRAEKLSRSTRGIISTAFFEPEDSRMDTIIDLTFSEAVAGFTLNLKARHLSEHTVADYLNTFRKFADYLKQDLPLSKITHTQIEGFLAAQTVSKKTCLNYHTGLAALWTWAVKFHYAAEHIVHQVEPPDPEKRVIVPFTEDDVKRILDALVYTRTYCRPGKRASRHKLKDADRNKAIVLLLLDTGMRASEICGLKIADMDLRNYYIKPFGKGDKERIIPFSARTGQAVFKYLVTRKSEPVNNPLFVTSQGRAMDRGQLLKLLVAAGKRAGVQDTHPHRFRHTFAITYLRNGGDAYTLQRMLGHTSMDMVRTYLDLANTDLQRGHRIASPVDNWKL
jgi:site-specific recombinase XerD